MTKPLAANGSISSLGVSPSLLGAALAGLLCWGGCSTHDTSADKPGGTGGTATEQPHITSDENVGVMTEAQFTALCDARGGTVEVMPHCGGFATAKGFSYDSTTELLSEHTCHGANTCSGWNCAIPD